MNPVAGKSLTFEIVSTVESTVVTTQIFPQFLTAGDSTESGSWDFYVRIDLIGKDLARVDFLKITDDAEYEFQTEVRQLRRLGEFFRRDSSYTRSSSAEFYEKIADLLRVLNAIPKSQEE